MEDVAREWRLRGSSVNVTAEGGVEAAGCSPSPVGGGSSPSGLALAGSAAGGAAASSPAGSVRRTTGTPPASPAGGEVRLARSFVPHSSFSRYVNRGTGKYQHPSSAPQLFVPVFDSFSQYAIGAGLCRRCHGWDQKASISATTYQVVVAGYMPRPEVPL